jgi:hypothetical protein
VGIESSAFVLHAQLEASRMKHEAHPHALALVHQISVLDGVDQGLAQRHAHVMARIFVQVSALGDMREHGLRRVQKIEPAGHFQPDRVPSHQSHVLRFGKRNCSDDARTKLSCARATVNAAFEARSLLEEQQAS